VTPWLLLAIIGFAVGHHLGRAKAKHRSELATAQAELDAARTTIARFRAAMLAGPQPEVLVDRDFDLVTAVMHQQTNPRACA
jgi:hypothetical protein